MTAVFSDCGRYRYLLERDLGLLGGKDGYVLFGMLNPSKAGRIVNGSEITDPTATRVAGFTAAWGYSRYAIVNAYSFIATDPDELTALEYEEAVGPDNDRQIIEAARNATLIVAAWGASYPKALAHRLPQMRTLLATPGKPVHHLGLTKSGDPKHPLYLPADTQPTLWEAA